MAEKKKAEIKAEVVEEKKTAKQVQEEFIARKMKAVNQMTSPAKAKRAAMRVLANRKVGK